MKESTKDYLWYGVVVPIVSTIVLSALALIFK